MPPPGMHQARAEITEEDLLSADTTALRSVPNPDSDLAPNRTACPAWCVFPEECATPRLYDDREHRSTTHDVDLTREPLIGDVHADLTAYLRHNRAGACLEQHDNAQVPHLVLHHGETFLERIELTLDEAEDLARGILHLVAEGRR
jgi:hypothetical protein